ncbi:phosphoglucosamine mutase [Natronoarchaeum philippinense]|uniref:Phosphoglucosamine mutase n=1 Tax=Natronoarchaeum philippinense TaxID=558529 RepID=A0A285P3A4_NATPI|nr:phosphoglucosamine mutase [Natronoarchaeum philippinense]SNZ15737.1 phosphoglucosamine mutase [Natronoarchaeum philippinense]
MFGTSGIRGPVGETVTAELALSVGRAVGIDADRIVVGRDPRESGRVLTDALAAGARECGADVIDLGLAATPTVARAVGWRDADAGVSITASHNPAPDNGIKLWTPSGQAFDEERRTTIERRVREEAWDLADWTGQGERSHWDGARERHVEALTEAVSIDESLSVVVDVGNGAGGVTADALAELCCSVETLNAQPDGSFPGRPSEPTPEHCGTLAATVAATDADLGIAHDGDADRMRAVAGDGTFLSGDVLLALFGREAAASGDRVAVPVDTSLAVADALASVGAETTRTPVGDVYVAERASESGVAFGGEPSGAWIWPEETLCPDGPLAACRLAALVARRGPLAELADGVETYPIRRENVETDEKGRVMERVEGLVADRYDGVETLDGVRVDMDEGWFLVRASGTQPLVRVTAEAREPDAADAVLEEAMGILADARA